MILTKQDIKAIAIVRDYTNLNIAPDEIYSMFKELQELYLLPHFQLFKKTKQQR